MKQVLDLFDLVSARPTEAEGPARRMDLVLRAGLATVAFAGLYGLAAGSTSLGLALGNLYKVPMVILLSTLCALPIGMLTWKLTGAPNRASDLLLGTASGNFTGALVLAALAPVVALYYHSSSWLGGVLALVAAGAATLVGMFNLARAVMNRAPVEAERFKVALPVFVIMLAQTAALIQFIHVASPIIPETTVFDGGADAMLGR